MPLVPQSSQGQQVPFANPRAGDASILNLASGQAWRQFLRRAKFRDAEFYVDTGVRESGRRVVQHEFPKRNVPYSEDMGRRAREFTVRGYLIVFPSETLLPSDGLKKKNYLPARDRLIAALESDGTAILRLPLLGDLEVMAQRYRVTEEDKFGGYCVFDMTFVEFGQAPATGTRDSAAGVQYASDALGQATQTAMTEGIRRLDGLTASANP